MSLNPNIFQETNPAAGNVLTSQGAGVNPQFTKPVSLSMLNGNGAVTANSTGYYSPSGTSDAAAGVDDMAGIVMPIAGVISSLHIGVDVAPGAGHTVAVTLVKNDVETTLTCTISGATAVAASDTTHSVTVAAGDTLKLKVVASASAASAYAGFGLLASITAP